MGGKRGTPVSHRTLDLLIDHLRDLYLPTILARIADRSEPYLLVSFIHNIHTEGHKHIILNSCGTRDQNMLATISVRIGGNVFLLSDKAFYHFTSASVAFMAL